MFSYPDGLFLYPEILSIKPKIFCPDILSINSWYFVYIVLTFCLFAVLEFVYKIFLMVSLYLSFQGSFLFLCPWKIFIALWNAFIYIARLLSTIPAIINLTHLSEAAPLDWWELQSHGEKEKVSLSSYLLTQKISFCYDIPCLRNLSFSEKSHFSIPRPL